MATLEKKLVSNKTKLTKNSINVPVPTFICVLLTQIVEVGSEITASNQNISGIFSKIIFKKHFIGSPACYLTCLCRVLTL